MQGRLLCETHARIVTRSIVRTVLTVLLVATQPLPFPYPYLFEERPKEGKVSRLTSSYLARETVVAGYQRSYSGALYHFVTYSSYMWRKYYHKGSSISVETKSNKHNTARIQV